MVQDCTEPIASIAPGSAGKNVANPFWNDSVFLAMCLREDLDQRDAADELEQHIYNMMTLGKRQQI